MHTFRRIKGHRIRGKDKNKKYEVEIEWVDGTSSWEPLGNIAEDAPDCCAEYARANNISELDETWDDYFGFLIAHAEEADVEDSNEEEEDDDEDDDDGSSSEDSDED